TGSAYQWTGPLSFFSSAQNPQIPNPSPGTSGNYSLLITSPLGCTNAAVANVTVTAMPVVIFTTSSPQCEGSVLILDASATSGAITYNWSGPNGFLSNLVVPQITNVSLPAAGIYTLSVTAGPCSSTITHSVALYQLPSLSIYGGSSVCEKNVLSLGINTSPGINSFAWIGPSGFNQSTSSFTRSPAQLNFSGTYTAIVKDSHGCINSATLSVKIMTLPLVTVAGATVCLNYAAT